jgi:hypothetical protein
VVVKRERQVFVLRPRARHILRHRHAAVAANHDVVPVVRIHPDGVDVVMDRLSHVGPHRRAAVVGHVDADAAEVHAIRIGAVDADLAEVHRRGLFVLTRRHVAPPSSER